MASLRRFGIIALGAAAAIAALFFAFRWLRHDAERDEALRLAQAGKYDDACPLLQRCLERDPVDVELTRARALAAMKAGRVDDAKSALDRWCAIQKDDADPFRARIDYWLAVRQLPPAIADARRVLELQPDDVELRQQRAEWLLRVGELEEADRECQRCRETKPDDLGLMQLQAKISHASGDSTRTEKLVDTVLKKEPSRTGAMVLRAALYLEAGRPEDAIPLLRRALSAGREYQEAARYYLSQALVHTGQTEEAKRVLEELKAQQAFDLARQYGQTDHKVGLQVRVAESLLATGHATDGLKLLNQVLADAPDCPSAHQALADYYERNGPPDKAEFHRKRAQY